MPAFALSSTHPLLRKLAVLTLAVSLAGCGGGTSSGQAKGKGARAPQGPAQVGFVVVQPTSVPLTAQLSGRTVAYQSSEVRPQVSGIVQKRLFTEGSIVRAGQPLYQIDASLYRAAANQAQANLAAAQATASASQTQAQRLGPLAQMQAVSQQDYTNAVAQARQGQAQIRQNQAQLETARINLRFTTVPAPISGRVGRSAFTVGALVTTSQADPLTTIQQLDPIYVDMQQSSADLLALRRSLADERGIMPTRAQVHLQLEDGGDYAQTGTIEFAEVVVDQATGTVTLRARFPNPQGVLLPGMFVRASFAQAVNSNAFLVPQQAVSRDPRGAATLFVVGQGDRAVQKTVTADRTQGAFWVVTAGLQAGDRVITQGLNRLKPGAPIRPVPADAPQRVVPPKGKAGGKPSGAGGLPEAGGSARGAGGGGRSSG